MNISSLQPLTFCIAIFFLAVSAAKPVYSHIETDMPDPIAEVEYQMMLDFEPDDKLTRYKLAMIYYRQKKDAKAAEKASKKEDKKKKIAAGETVEDPVDQKKQKELEKKMKR